MALSKDKIRRFERGDFNELPLKAGAKVYEGSFVGKDTATGYSRALVAGDVFQGIAESPVDNTSGSNGDLRTRTRARDVVLLAISGLAITDVDKAVFASDDDTATLTSSGNSYIGKVIRFESTGFGWVSFEPAEQNGVVGADLTAATGTASTTIADVGAAFNQTTLNNNFKSLADRVNALAALLK